MDLQGYLRRSGLRVTAPRLAVLAALEELPPHQGAEAIASRARARLGALSTQAVYDSLRLLTEVGLVRRIEPAGSAALYELRVGDNHHHIVCRGCGLTRDVDCVVGHAPCLQPSDDGGFRIDEAEVTFWGLCPECQAREEAELEASGAPQVLADLAERRDTTTRGGEKNEQADTGRAD